MFLMSKLIYLDILASNVMILALVAPVCQRLSAGRPRVMLTTTAPHLDLQLYQVKAELK